MEKVVKKVPFNINHYVHVKLTERGLEVLRKQHDDLYKLWPNPPEYVPPIVDENGYTKMQAWVLMQTFGPHITMGMNAVPFETAIFVELEAA